MQWPPKPLDLELQAADRPRVQELQRIFRKAAEPYIAIQLSQLSKKSVDKLSKSDKALSELLTYQLAEGFVAAWGFNLRDERRRAGKFSAVSIYPKSPSDEFNMIATSVKHFGLSGSQIDDILQKALHDLAHTDRNSPLYSEGKIALFDKLETDAKTILDALKR